MDTLRVEFRDIAATVGWAIVIASIVLQALYIRFFLTELELILLFLVSTVVGSVLVDVGKVVVGFVGAVALAIVIAYFCLILPSMLRIAGVTGEAMYSGAIVMIFRSTFPIPLIAILFGGFFGSFVGEMLRLR